VERVVFMKAAQTGATEAANNFISFVIHQAPGPIPAGIQCQLIVGDHQRLALRIRQMAQPYDRHLIQP
jgi:phage terminase large subunit GpA-like protein